MIPKFSDWNEIQTLQGHPRNRYKVSCIALWKKNMKKHDSVAMHSTRHTPCQVKPKWTLLPKHLDWQSCVILLFRKKLLHSDALQRRRSNLERSSVSTPRVRGKRMTTTAFNIGQLALLPPLNDIFSRWKDFSKHRENYGFRVTFFLPNWVCFESLVYWWLLSVTFFP